MLLACTAGLLTFTAPASASHLKGGSISAGIGANGHITGQVELIYSSLSTCPASPAGLAPIQVSGPAGFSATPAVTGVVMATCLPSTKTARGAFDVDLSSGADGTYTATSPLVAA